MTRNFLQQTVAAAIEDWIVPNSPPQNPLPAPPGRVTAFPPEVAFLVAPGINTQSKPLVVSLAAFPYPQHFDDIKTMP